MFFGFLLPAASLFLLPADDITMAQPGAAVTAVTTPAVVYGRVIGAATQCSEIQPLRVKHAITAINVALLLRAHSKDAYQVAAKQFQAAIAEGAEALTDGQITCAQTRAELQHIAPEREPPPHPRPRPTSKN